MKTRKALTILQMMAAGGIIGAAIMGGFFNGAEVQLGKLDLNSVGAIAGGALSLIAAKVIHFF